MLPRGALGQEKIRQPAHAFIRGYLKGLAWTLDPANREAAEALLLAKMPEIQPAALQSVMDSLLSPSSGLTPNARIIPDGMERVLELRSRYGAAAAPLTDAANIWIFRITRP